MSIDRTYAPEDLKRTQDVLLDILKDVLRVCDENGIHIFVEGGSAIGAVRHGGFIPWDDDIDLWVLREDYDKLLTILPEQLDPRYGMDDWLSNKDFPAPNLCVYAKGSISVPVEMKNCKYKYGISLGIYPYDNIPDDDKKAKRQISLCWFLMRLHWLKVLPFPYIPYHGIKKTIIHAICGIAHVCLLPIPKKWIVKQCEKVSNMYKDIETTRAAVLSYTYPWDTVIKKDKIYPSCTMPFEDTTVEIYGAYHELLTQEYGDYMQLPPPEKRKNHFPCELKFPNEEATKH